MSSSDFFKKFQPLFEAADPKVDKKKLQDPPKEVKIDKDLTKKGYGKQSKATNVKENAADFFRKYSDIIKEAEEQEELEESSDDPFADDYKDPGDKEPKSKKVAGKSYGGSKQDDDNKDEPWYAKKDPESGKKGKKKVKETEEVDEAVRVGMHAPARDELGYAKPGTGSVELPTSQGERDRVAKYAKANRQAGNLKSVGSQATVPGGAGGPDLKLQAVNTNKTYQNGPNGPQTNITPGSKHAAADQQNKQAYNQKVARMGNY